MRHALIMAGGAGTRLWPLSRRKRPKQLLRLFENQSLLQLARRRLAGLFEPANIWVITSQSYINLVRNELPDLPHENLIGEPEGRDTANAIGLAAHLLHRRDPDGTMAVFTADHIITPIEEFQAAISRGLAAAEQQPGALVTFGITPDSPHTGYGYIHRGDDAGPGVSRVLEFREKPSLAVAEGYVKSGAYLWNSGMFVWRTQAILAELERCLPDNYRALGELAAGWKTLSGTERAARMFAAVPKISIDFGVMEKAGNVLVVEMPCKWQDLGSWTAIAATRDADAGGNIIVAPQTITLDARDNIVVSDSGHLIVLLGVSDLVVVHAGDATLVCRKEHEQRLKELVKIREQHFGSTFE
ncbi:MAG: mannose-1-phosphate guanylyltransferase [Phycisphaerales bacterium]|nr:mannose-1-phosphate guanylyltransferase [Phycisphaerales bacterium]